MKRDGIKKGNVISDYIRWSSPISSRHASTRNCVIFLQLLKTDDDHSFLNRAIKMGQWKLPQIRC